jgi:CheY-like chemotaxis protein
MSHHDADGWSAEAADPVKILVIEDNIDDQDMLRRQLQKSGVHDRVLCVGDGGDALRLLREGTRKLSEVAAIFLDLSLPGVSGLLLLHAIRANVETALLPVFVMTGSTNPKDEVECKRLGATSFILKGRLSLPAFRATIAEMFPVGQAENKHPSPGCRIEFEGARELRLDVDISGKMQNIFPASGAQSGR